MSIADFNNVSELPDEDDETGFDPESGVTLEEGGITVQLDDDDDAIDTQKDDPEFDDDLTENLSKGDREALGGILKEFVMIDVESRQGWYQRMVDGLEIIGLKDVPDDRTAFMGASAVTHPGIAEAIVQFQARAMEELLPPTGPVKVGTVGDAEEADIKRAERVEEYMNYQLTDEDDEYYADTDGMLFYLPYAGSAFKKVAIDPVIGRTRSRYITAEDFIVPSFAKSLATAPRYTHRYTMPLNTFKRAVARGNFSDWNFSHNNLTMSQGDEHRLADVSDDKEDSYHPDDTVLTLCETHIEWEFEWEKMGTDQKYKKPYVITWEWETGAVVGIKRLWAEDDKECKKQVWFVHFKYLPGFGFYGLGLLHLIGGLGKAASGALRAVLDGSMTSSLQGGFKSKEAKVAGDVVFSPGTWIDVDMSAEEMAKAFYSPPWKEPSPALFKTLELLVQGIQRFASTTEAMVGDASNTGPVGTTVALIEQGSKIFSGIHKRIHQAARMEFKLIQYCNYRYMHQDEYPYNVSGESKSVFRSDFAPDVDVQPVSDPNIFSSVQRIALAQAVMQLVQQFPQDFPKKSRRKAIQSMLKALKVPEAKEYMPDSSDEIHMDPVSENESMSMGSAVAAFPDQDHQAHMAIHGAYVQEIIATGDQQTIQQIVPVIKAHITAHFAQAYRLRIEQQLQQGAGVPLPDYDPNDPGSTEELPIEIENAIARAVAATLAPPPPPPQPQQDPKQQAFEAAEKRKQQAFQSDQQRKDMEQKLDLQRKGIIPDDPNPQPPPQAPQMQAQAPPPPAG